MTATTVKLSWAQIVKGKADQCTIDSDTSPPALEPLSPSSPILEPETTFTPVPETPPEVLPEVEAEPASPLEPEVPAAHKPGLRGDRQCWCRGELLVMLGHYGWIMALDDIDHPDANKNGGRIYVSRRDLVGRCLPRDGDVVGFFLYADHQGLGAEACCLEQPIARAKQIDLDDFVSTGDMSDASTDVPSFRHEADEFVPNSTNLALGFNTYAKEFVPSAAMSMNVGAAEFVPGFAPCRVPPQPIFTHAPKSYGHPYGNGVRANPFQAMIAGMINPAYLLDDSDDEDSGSEADKESSCEGHDRSSDTSGDENLQTVTAETDTETDGEASKSPPNTFRAPPGLSLPPGLEPPPGLCFPPGFENRSFGPVCA